MKLKLERGNRFVRNVFGMSGLKWRTLGTGIEVGVLDNACTAWTKPFRTFFHKYTRTHTCMHTIYSYERKMEQEMQVGSVCTYTRFCTRVA